MKTKCLAIAITLIAMLASCASVKDILTISTSAPFYPSSTTTENTKQANLDCSQRIKPSEVSFFAIENFDHMQLERFYADKPYIDSFAVLTGLEGADIEVMLVNSLAMLIEVDDIKELSDSLAVITGLESADIEEKLADSLAMLKKFASEDIKGVVTNDTFAMFLRVVMQGASEIIMNLDIDAHKKEAAIFVLENYEHTLLERFYGNQPNQPLAEFGSADIEAMLTAADDVNDASRMFLRAIIQEMSKKIIETNASSDTEKALAKILIIDDIDDTDDLLEMIECSQLRIDYGTVRYENDARKYEVYYMNGRLNGLAKFYNEDGKLAGEGRFIDNKPQDGFIRNYSKDYITSEVNYKNGKLDGLAKFYYKNEPIEHEAQYINGKQNGLARYYEENGKLAGEGTFIDDKPQDGVIRHYEYSRIVSEINYKNGKMDGLAKFYYGSKEIGLEREANYKDGKMNGLVKYYEANGDLAGEGRFIDNVPQGGFVRTYGRGKADNCDYITSEVNYKAGERNGFAKYYKDYRDYEFFSPFAQPQKELMYTITYEDGKVAEGKFIDNNAYIFTQGGGLRKFYYKDGLIEHEVQYINGKQHGLAKYYEENGDFAGEGTFIDDKPQDGFIRHYDYGNNIISERSYKNGKMDGLAKFYYRSKEIGLEREANYKDGKMNGLVKYYEANGELAGEGTFIDDKPQDGFIRTYGYRASMTSYEYESYGDGDITSEVNYKAGKLDGWAKYYENYRGYNKFFTPLLQSFQKKLVRTFIYKDGKFVSGTQEK
ncbi:MAG: toxin-antitoxin system YwqK family antitoxin [Deferribacteraceae bacterium]|jgi:antitoxin component YwqK of YwqJK toxin-antitoxin module|nr:toxin-antitoxin system YwqK family antitoxin [Deferribacteraceae bacterium]